MPGATSLLAAIPSSIAGTVADGGETAGKGAARTRRPPQAPKLPDLWSAHYLLDFGFVTKGINKSRKVKLTNTSTQTVSYHRGLLGQSQHVVICCWCLRASMSLDDTDEATARHC